jgi:hypothetical protein
MASWAVWLLLGATVAGCQAPCPPLGLSEGTLEPIPETACISADSCLEGEWFEVEPVASAFGSDAADPQNIIGLVASDCGAEVVSWRAAAGLLQPGARRLAELPGDAVEMATADLDNDGASDVIVGIGDDDTHDGQIVVLLSREGRLEQAQAKSTDSVSDLVACDLDGDGAVDIAAETADLVCDDDICDSRLTLWLGFGTGDGELLLEKIEPSIVAESPAGLNVIDLDGDGRCELVHLDNHVRVDADRTVSSADLPISTYFLDVATHDWSGDGLPDLVSVDGSDLRLHVQQSDGSMVLASELSLGTSASARLEGLIGLGANDVGVLVTTQDDSETLFRVLRPTDTAIETVAETSVADTIASSIVTADLDGDGTGELVARFRVDRKTWRVGTLQLQ